MSMAVESEIIKHLTSGYAMAYIWQLPEAMDGWGVAAHHSYVVEHGRLSYECAVNVNASFVGT